MPDNNQPQGASAETSRPPNTETRSYCPSHLHKHNGDYCGGSCTLPGIHSDHHCGSCGEGY